MKAGALALTLGIVLVATGCADDPAAATRGDIVQGRLGDVSGSEHSVLVPTGEVMVQLSGETDTVSAEQAADAQEHEAPPGSRWIGIDWEFTPGADFDPFHRTLMADPAARTSLALEVAGETYELGDAAGSTSTPVDTRTSGIIYLAVEQDAAPVLLVTFDGVVTRLDTATGEVEGEQAAALGDLTAPTTRECPEVRARSGGVADVACSYVVTQVPYLADRGWSSEGWVVAQVETRVDSFEIGASTYAVHDVEDSSSLGESAPGAGTVVTRQRDSLVTRIVAEGTADRLDIARILGGALASGPGPDHAELTVSSSVDLP